MRIKKAAALILSALLCAGIFAGCNTGSTSSTATPSSAASSTADSSAASTEGESSSEEASTEGTDTGERATITFMGINYTTTPFSSEGADQVLAKMEEYTNTKVEFTWVPNDSYKEKLGVTLMSADNMPMILTVGEMNATVIQAAKAGAFWDLNNYMFDSAKYPNLSQANADVNSQIMVGGQLVGVYRARPIGRNGIGYRGDWAEKLGLSEPETIEDLYNMCKAFTEQDPDGDGVKNTYGIALCKYTGPLDMIQVWFGAGNKWTEQDGKLVPSHMTAGWKEAADWTRKMYEEGLVYKDWAVRDPNTWSDSIRNGECGVMLSVLDDSRRNWDYFEANEIPAVTGDGFASMGLRGTLSKEAGGTQMIQATTGMSGFFAITKAAKTEEDLANCLHFLDKMNDNEMLVLADYGLQGEATGWDFDEEGFVVMNDPSIQAETRPQHGANQTLAYIPNLASTEPVLKQSERVALEMSIKEANEPFAVFNPAAGYLSNSETYGVNGANLDQILEDARTQYICGQIDDAGLEAAFANWATQGGDKVIEEVNALYQADK